MNRNKMILFAILCLSLLCAAACGQSKTSTAGTDEPSAPSIFGSLTPSPALPSDALSSDSLACIHQFDNWQEVRAATCLEEGEKKQVCVLCGEERLESIPKVLEHAFMDDGACKICHTPIDEGFVFEENGNGESYSFSYKGEGTTVTVPSTFNDLPVTCVKHVRDHIKRVILPDSIVEIGPYAFFLCDEMTYIKLPQNLKIINTYAFNGCTALQSVVLPKSVTFIGERAFANCSFSSLTLNEGLVSIGDYAFDTCANVTTLTIPATVETIGEGAFQSFGALKALIFKEGSSLKSIGKGAFTSGAELKEVILPDGLLSIGEGAFRRREGLVSVVIPATVTSIGKEAFKGLSNVVFTFNGTEAQWETIEKGENWDAQCDDYSLIFKGSQK